VIEERLRSRIAPDSTKVRYMTASKVLEDIGFRNPSNMQCKECGAVLRSIYGPPKRVNGLMKWKVALKPHSEWEHEPGGPEEDEY
jgi:putative DNA primase/helicase